VKLAVLSRPADPPSLRLHEENMCRELAALGVEVCPIPEEGPVPGGCDAVWEPGLCMRRIPPVLASAGVPVVGTVHGVKAFALPPEEVATGAEELRALRVLAAQVAGDWVWFRDTAAAVVGVSAYAAAEAAAAFDLPPERVHAVHHGVDPARFAPGGERMEIGRPYLLCVARLDPIKNLERLLAAYARLAEATRPALVLILPEEADEPPALAARFAGPLPDGVHLVREVLPQEALARWYRGALALVLPSLRETFGLPLVEAMACGCPVVTSDGTGCAEVAGDAALLVDPRSVDQIAAALACVAADADVRASLRTRGLERAAGFRWRRSAAELLRLIHAVLPPQRPPRMRKLEVTTTAGCRVACEFCPQKAFSRGYIRTGAVRTLAWETFTAALARISPEVGVSFGGMSEPFQNPRCTDMVLHATARGHEVEIFTTLVGLDPADLPRLLAGMRLDGGADDDRLYVHVPSVENFERIPITDGYLAMLRRFLDAGPSVAFHYHGSRPHEGLRDLPFGDRLHYWAIHDRAHNDIQHVVRGARKRGRLACIMNLEVNILLPNADVLICSQDFGAEHVIGNLGRQSPESLYEGEAFQRFQAAMADDAEESMCRHCHFAVELDPSPAPAA
jgi:radical SAM protein with 4Fe4S-binding SPASM domain